MVWVLGWALTRICNVSLVLRWVHRRAKQWLCVEQSHELFTNIRRRGGASNPFFHSWMRPSHKPAVKFWKFWQSQSCPFQDSRVDRIIVMCDIFPSHMCEVPSVTSILLHWTESMLKSTLVYLLAGHKAEFTWWKAKKQGCNLYDTQMCSFQMIECNVMKLLSNLWIMGSSSMH